MSFVYVVKPVLGQWEVGFGDNGSRFLYAGRDEAEQVARGAAQLHWETRNEPAGVRLELPGERPSILAEFGPARRRHTPVP
ncbi:MAG: hypothetical protein ACREO3_05235 [Arenimonas sp.]